MRKKPKPDARTKVAPMAERRIRVFVGRAMARECKCKD